jgi:hypothetical protein
VIKYSYWYFNSANEGILGIVNLHIVALNSIVQALHNSDPKKLGQFNCFESLASNMLHEVQPGDRGTSRYENFQ